MSRAVQALIGIAVMALIWGLVTCLGVER